MSRTSYFDIIKDKSDRVIQVDRECYLIYLGTSFFEKAPFLQVGTSSHLSKKLKEQVGYLVLTGREFGNIYEFEKAFIPGRKLNIIGTSNFIGTFFSALKNKKLPVSNFNTISFDLSSKKKSSTILLKFDQYDSELSKINKPLTQGDDEKKNEHRLHAHSEKAIDVTEDVTLTLDNNGNFFVMIGGETVFDLKIRLREGITSNVLLDDISDEFIYKNRHFMRGRGFSMAGGSLSYYNQDRLFLSALPKGYFRELIKSNIDPDNITFLYQNEDSNSYEDFIKREVTTGHSMKIYSSDEEKLIPHQRYYDAKNIQIKRLGKDKLSVGSAGVEIVPDEGRIQFQDKLGKSFISYFTGDQKNNTKIDIDADINIIPSSMASLVKEPDDMIVLVYEKGNNAFRSSFNSSGKLYKLFPYIDYRYNRLFPHNQRVYYGLDIYLKDILYDYPKVFREFYVNFANKVNDLLDYYIQRSDLFKLTLNSLLNTSRTLMPPVNRYEYFILHNCIEFIRYLNHILKSRAVLRLKVLDQIEYELINMRNRSSDIEISDMNIKGDIALFPNDRLYLFYTTVERIEDDQIPRQHELLLIDKLFDNRKLLELDRNRNNLAISSFVKELSQPGLLNRFQSKSDENYNRLIDDLSFFENEIIRAENINSFLTIFRTYSGQEQKQFYFLVKTMRGGLDDFERDEQLFGDLLDGFSFSSKKNKNYQTGHKFGQNKLNFILKFAFSSVVMIFLILLLYVNVSSLSISRQIAGFRREFISSPVIKYFFVKNYFKGWVDYYPYLFKEKNKKLPTLFVPIVTTKNGTSVTNFKVNEEIFKRAVSIDYEDFNNYFDKVLNLNLFKDEDLIYPGHLVKLDEDRFYRVEKLDSVWGISLSSLVKDRRYELSQLTRMHLLLDYYNKCIKKDDVDKKGISLLLRKVTIINKKINLIYDRSHSRQVKNYAGKLQHKAGEIVKYLSGKKQGV